MIRYAVCLLSAALIPMALQAQNANPTVTEMKAAYTSVKSNILKAADKVSEADYAFKASPDIRTLGELFQHIAQAQVNYCGRVTGNAKAPDFGSKSKGDVVTALKASFDVCDAGWEALTDANASEMTGQGRGALSKYGALLRNLIHDNEEYGYISVYLRIKGITPPSSEGAPAGAARGGRGGI
jgi:uncharacterized damage-inducible protein DinB